MSDYTNSGTVATFNEAALKMIRIHELQHMINRVRFSLLDKDPIAGVYNYKIMMANLESLYKEVRAKMSDSEKAIGDKWRDVVEGLNNSLPIERKTPKELYGSKKITTWIDQNSWALMRGALFRFEDFIVDMLEQHGLSTPNKDDVPIWDQ